MARGSSCCCNLPYVAVVSTVLAAVGLAIWWQYFHEAYNHTVDALKTLGVSYPQLQKFQSNAMGYLIFTCIDLVLVLLLGLWRSSLLCRRGSDGSSSSMFTFVGTVMTAVTFFSVVWVVVNLVAMGAATTALFIGHFAANTAGSELGKLGGTAANIFEQVNKVLKAYDGLSQGANNNALVGSALQTFSPTIEQLRPWVNGTKGGCPPLCLDLNSFKFLEVQTRCMCDSKVLQAAAVQAKKAGTAGVGTVIGGFLLFVGVLWLLMNLCGQVAGSCSDKYHESRREEEQFKGGQFHSA